VKGALAIKAVLAASLQAASATNAPWDSRMPANRLDCETNSHFQDSPEPLGAVSYSFVFPFNRDAHGDWPEMRWIMTQRDGRSWIDEGRIVSLEGTEWPDFTAEVELARTGSRFRFRSDAETRGRIAVSSLHITDHAGMIEEDGICRIVPDLHGNEGRAQ
jgi:hypothetical protein